MFCIFKKFFKLLQIFDTIGLKSPFIQKAFLWDFSWSRCFSEVYFSNTLILTIPPITNLVPNPLTTILCRLCIPVTCNSHVPCVSYASPYIRFCDRYARCTWKGRIHGGKGECMDLKKRRAREEEGETMELRWWEFEGLEREVVGRKRRKDKRLGGCERGACADETRSGTCGPHRSEPVREPHTTTPLNLSTWISRPSLSVHVIIVIPSVGSHRVVFQDVSLSLRSR